MNPKSKNKANDDCQVGTIAIVGPANAGKSTLLNQIVGEKVSIVSAKANTTRNRILAVKNTQQAQLIFIDSPGFVTGRKRNALNNLLEHTHKGVAGEADLVVWVLDGQALVGRNNGVEQVLQDFSSREVPKPAIVVINKIDSFEASEVLPLIASLNESLLCSGLEVNPEFLPLSAATGEGVDTFLDLLSKKLPEGPRLFPESILTDQTDEQRAAELIREQLFRQLREEVPYGTAVVLEAWEEGAKGITISAKIIVERDSHKGLLIGKKGSRLAAVGKASRMQLSKIFSAPVHLKLFVKVEEKWRSSQLGLEKVQVFGEGI